MLFQNMVKRVEKHFEGVPILNSFGNNDMLYNAEMPGRDPSISARDFFTALYRYWFVDVKANMKGWSGDKIQQLQASFSSAGYYSYDLDDQLTIISLNSIAICSRNKYFIGRGWPSESSPNYA